MRLNKFIAQSGYCSRRQADELIKSSKVLVNNMPVKDLGTKIDPSVDIVRIKKGPTLKPVKEKILIMLNKPKGFICTKRDKYAKRTVFDLLPEKYQGLFSIGRLDKDTEGLLLFTNDGEYANRLAHPSYNKDKTYRVWIRGKLSDKEKSILVKGIRLFNFRAKPAKVKEISYDKEKGRSLLEVTISEGKKRQIHHMFLALKHPVKKLLRISFGPYKLGRLKLGEWKELTFLSFRPKLKHRGGG